MARENTGSKENILAVDTSTAALVIGIGQLCHSEERSDEESQVVSSNDNRTRDTSASPQDDKPLYKVLASHFSIVDRKHLELSTAVIDDLTKEAGIELTDLSAVVAGLGPGSLIGTRVGVVVAKTLAQVLKVPLIGISTLDVIAAGPSKTIGKEKYPTPEALIKLGFEKLKKGQFSSIYELEPIYIRGPV